MESRAREQRLGRRLLRLLLLLLTALLSCAAETREAGAKTLELADEDAEQSIYVGPPAPDTSRASKRPKFSAGAANEAGGAGGEQPPVVSSGAASGSPAAAESRGQLVPFDEFRSQLRTLNLSAELRPPSPSGATNATDAPDEWLESGELALKLERILARLEADQVQSLVLSGNELQFELWSELYGLLARPLRRHLLALDLSHNSLAKLGITFTGYIEHHLAVHGSWPFGGGVGGSLFAPPQPHQPRAGAQDAANGSELAVPSLLASKTFLQTSSRISYTRHASGLLSSGKLFALVQRRLESIGSPLALSKAHEGAGELSGAPNASQQGAGFLHQSALLKALDLSHNKLKWLINDQFKALKHVQIIRLNNNRLRYIHQHAFSGLEALRYLSLEFNRLQVIYVEQFQTNYNLLSLELRSNNLAYLRAGSLASLSKLRRLDLSQNKFTILSNNAFVGLESVRHLNLSSNPMVHAPSAPLRPLTSLDKLDLSANQIAQLTPGSFFHLPVRELRLQQNDQLVSIDRGAFWDLPQLRTLNLSANAMLMTVNSQAFVGVPKLEQILVDGCQSLDVGTRQLLENVTRAATSRHLRLSEEKQQLTGGGSLHAPNATALPPLNVTDGQLRWASPQAPVGLGKGLGRGLVQSERQVRYFYYLGTVALLVVALKLVFKFTSTSHYVERRRQRRRVYELEPSDSSDGKTPSGSLGGTGSISELDELMAADCSRANAFQLREAGPDQLLVANLTAARARPQFRRSESDIYLHQDYSACGQLQHQQPHFELAATFGSSQSLSQLDSLAAQYALIEAQHQRQLAGATAQWPPPPPPSVANESGGTPTNYVIDLDSAASGEETVQRPATGAPTQCSCPDCPPQLSADAFYDIPLRPDQHTPPVQADSASPQPASPYHLFQSQLLEAGLEHYDHANCAHFYQSLGPALKLADMSANFGYY